MEYRCTSSGETIEVFLLGHLVVKVNKDFQRINSDIDGQDGINIVLDLTGVEFIDSAGLGFLLEIKVTAEKKGREVSMRVSEGGQVATMLEVAHFGGVIPVVQ
jgi:HptB-dependent secretion and biofilm anti anti-sigma factor